MIKKGYVFLLLLIAGIIIFGKWQDKKIASNLAFSKGTIFSQRQMLKGRTGIEVFFYYNDIKYYAFNNIKGVDCDKENFQKKAYNRKIYVGFDSLNPRNNFLITTRKEYQKYKLEYPLFLDSLQDCNE